MRVLALLLALGAPAAAFDLWPAKREAPAAETPSTAEVRRGDMRSSLVETGELAPKLKVDVKSDVTGHVTDVGVVVGQEVRKGQVLAVIQPGRAKAERYAAWEVRAPIDGVVVDRRVSKGDTVLSGLSESGAGTVLMTVADLRQMLAVIEVHQLDVLALKPGMEAGVRVDATRGEAFQGKIAFISPIARFNDSRVRVFKAEIEILTPDPRLKPGLACRVEIALSSRQGVLKVPIEALHDDGRETFVFLMSGGRAVRTPVKVGLRNESEAEVLAGLSESDRLSLAQ